MPILKIDRLSHSKANPCPEKEALLGNASDRTTGTEPPGQNQSVYAEVCGQ
jgi:hypothetical protein